MKKKAVRLLVPFIFVALLWSIPLKYVSGYWDGSVTDVLSQIFIGQILMYGKYNSHLWFLLAIFNVFLLAFIIEKYNLRKNPQAFFCALLVLSVVGRWLFGHHYNLVGITEAMSYLVWFYVGFYFERCRERVNLFIRSHIGWATVVAIIIIYAILVIANRHLPMLTGIGSIGYATYYPLAFMGMLATYTLCYKALQITPPHYLKFINRISRYSYGLYLFSDPINYVIIYVVAVYGLSCYFASDAFTVGIYLFRFLFTTAVAWGITVAVRKYTKLKI